jgi:GNAT superfamily N-acetyltransferase
MTIRVSTLTLDTIDDLPAPCRSCVVWEYGKRASDQAVKDEWVSAVLLDWGSCGRVAYVDDAPAGYVMYAPPRSLDGGMFSMTAVSSDAVLLTTLLVLPEFHGAGIGRLLVQAVAKDVVRRRGVRAVEAFGDQRGATGGCIAPADFLTAVGFKTVRPHPRYPRMRLDLRSLVWWRGEMGDAIERWLGAIRPEKASGPVGVNPSSSQVHREPADGRA